MMFAHHNVLSLAALLAALGLAPLAHAQTDRYEALATAPLTPASDTWRERPPPPPEAW